MLVDAHCHVDGSADSRGCAEYARNVRVCLMSTNPQDAEMLSVGIGLGNAVCAFGVHPWFSHWFYVGDAPGKLEHYSRVMQADAADEGFLSLVDELPDPIDLDQYIRDHFPKGRWQVIGEVGLDKLFRVKRRDGTLSRWRVSMDHQRVVLDRFLDLAVRTGLSVSLHGVKAHGSLLDRCEKKMLNTPCNICLHSYTGPADTLTALWIRKFGHERIFVSLSQYINLDDKHRAVTENILDICPKTCILPETDFEINKHDAQRLEMSLRTVYNFIGQRWGIDNYEELMQTNFESFYGHSIAQ